MADIDKIFEMIDWNKPVEVQEKGIKEAETIKSFNSFIQPKYPYGKSVWLNCARIIANKTDDELYFYLPELMDWLDDINWPGAEIIFDRLLKINNNEQFDFLISERIKRLTALDEENARFSMLLLKVLRDNGYLDIKKTLEKKLEDSLDDFIKYLLFEIQNPRADVTSAYYLLKDHLKYHKDERIITIGSYLEANYHLGNNKFFLSKSDDLFITANNQLKSVIYYLRALDDDPLLYKKPDDFVGMLKKSIELTNRFVNNYLLLAKNISDPLEAKRLKAIALSNVEKRLDDSIEAQLQRAINNNYDDFLDECVLGVYLSNTIYEEVKNEL